MLLSKPMLTVLLVIHFLVAVLLILVVLLQQPQKGGMSTVFGGGESIFGGGGISPFMTKLTSALAVLFMLTSLLLVLTSARSTRTRIPERPPVEERER